MDLLAAAGAARAREEYRTTHSCGRSVTMVLIIVCLPSMPFAVAPDLGSCGATTHGRACVYVCMRVRSSHVSALGHSLTHCHNHIH